MQSARLCIPVLDSEDVVVVPANGLPSEAEEMLEVLASEAAPLSTWFDVARAYLAQGREDAFRHICLEGVKDEVTTEVERYFGRKPTYEQIQFYCGLAALHMAKARDEKDRTKKAEHLTQAAIHLNAAQTLDPSEQLVALGQGLLGLTKVGVQIPCVHASMHTGVLRARTLGSTACTSAVCA